MNLFKRSKNSIKKEIDNKEEIIKKLNHKITACEGLITAWTTKITKAETIKRVTYCETKIKSNENKIVGHNKTIKSLEITIKELWMLYNKTK